MGERLHEVWSVPPSGFDSPAALLDGHFEHPAAAFSSSLRHADHQNPARTKWFFSILLVRHLVVI